MKADTEQRKLLYECVLIHAISNLTKYVELKSLRRTAGENGGILEDNV